jgi:hypothetical protein
MKKLDSAWSGSPEKTRFSRRVANAGLLLAPAGMAASLAGCSGYVEDEVATLTESLNPAYWRTWSGALTAPAPWVDEPTLCSNSIPAVTYVVKSGTDQRYYVRQSVLSLAPSWKVFDSTPRVFASPPSCVMEHPAGTVPQPSGLPLFLIAGKSENKIFVVEGEVQNVGPGGVPVNPIWKGPWAQVSSTTYGAFQGYPAISSNGQKVVVTFMSNNTIYAHTRNLPYAAPGNTWGSRIAGPSLPSGVTIPTEPEGYYAVPGVIYMGGAHNKFLMMVRAQNSSGTKRLYYITFNGTSFGSWSGPASTSSHSIDSDPALEFDHEYDALSVYFRSGNEIKHTSVVNPSNIGSEPIWAIDEPASPVMYGAPRVVWGGGTEGNRTLLVRGFLPSTPDNLKSRTILANAGIPGHPPWD